MHAIAIALADPVVRAVYLVFCFAVLIVPMIVLAIWYGAQLARTAAGDAARRKQARIGTGLGSLGPALDFCRDIAAGATAPTSGNCRTRSTCWPVSGW